MGVLFGILTVATVGGLGVLAWQHQQVAALEAQAEQADAAARVAEAAVEKLELEVLMQALDQARVAQQMLLFVVIVMILALMGMIALWFYARYHNQPHQDQIRMEHMLQWLILRELRNPALSTEGPLDTSPDSRRLDGALVANDDPFWAA